MITIKYYCHCQPPHLDHKIIIIPGVVVLYLTIIIMCGVVHNVLHLHDVHSFCSSCSPSPSPSSSSSPSLYYVKYELWRLQFLQSTINEKQEFTIFIFQNMSSLPLEFSPEKTYCHFNFVQWWQHSHHPNMIAGIDHVTRNTKEMPNCTVGKSNLAVFEQILLRNCFEHGQLLKDKTKVSVSEIKSIP